MKKVLNLLKRAPKRFIALFAVLASIIIPAAILAYGPERPSYTIEQVNGGALGDKIVLNSISDNPNIGHEFNFVGIREKGTDTNWFDTMKVQPGKEYSIRIYVHNNSPKGVEAVAKNVIAKFNVPTTTGKSVEVNGFLHADNAEVKDIWDHATFTSNEDFNIAYVAGSARYGNNANGAFTLPDSIVTNTGAQLGYETLNGEIPGCFQYAGYVTITVKPQFAENNDYTLAKTVLRNSDKTWQESITANAGDTVTFQLEFKNTGDTHLSNVSVRDTLPAGLTYVPNSTMLYNTTNPNGLTLDDNISTIISESGVNIGGYNAGGNAYVRFKATVASNDNLPVCGENKLTNWGQVNAEANGTVNDDASVIVNKDCPETTPDPEPKYCKPGIPEGDPRCYELPVTGPASVSAGIIGAGSLTTAVIYYIVSRKKLNS